MSTRKDYRLFSPGKLGRIQLKNRLVRSGTYESAMSPQGKATESMLNLYRDLARGGVGLIITGSMTVVPEGKLCGKMFPRETCIYDDVFIDEIGKIADTIHSVGNDTKAVAQINHAGRQVAHDNRHATPVGPSEIRSPVLKRQARALTIEEVRYLINCFVDAIVRVKKAGFDGVQLHAGHGWLLSSFLSPYTNQRTDDYGGSFENRVRIIRDIVHRARDLVGDFPILIKMNAEDHVAGGISFDTFPIVAKLVAGCGIDGLEISGGMWDCLARSRAELGFIPMPIPESRTRIHSPRLQSYFLPYTEHLEMDIPLILVGGNRNVELMENILKAGKISFLSLSRPLICEPDLPEKWLSQSGAVQAECVSCNACLLKIKYDTLGCMKKANKGMQTIVKEAMPGLWKAVFK